MMLLGEPEPEPERNFNFQFYVKEVNENSLYQFIMSHQLGTEGWRWENYTKTEHDWPDDSCVRTHSTPPSMVPFPVQYEIIFSLKWKGFLNGTLCTTSKYMT